MDKGKKLMFPKDDRHRINILISGDDYELLMKAKSEGKIFSMSEIFRMGLKLYLKDSGLKQ